ncbi:MAG: TonB-like protein [Acidobacteriaceae bacterium]|jgi:TonB family protein|nr:TonB-like protein [Acidobacteriaceae bacterium]
MFNQIQHPARSKASIVTSALIHCAILGALIASYRPQFITPSSIAFGNHGSGSSAIITYLANSGETQSLSAKLQAPRTKPQHKSKTTKAEKMPAAKAPVESSRAGSPYGSTSAISMSGYEARPAFPITFPDPPRSDLPDGVKGDVVVEVTIDTQGNVAETKILQSLGNGIDDKVLAVLRNWRFTPATMNGVAIASRQDVHFHFPS